eukprot:13200886-Alexandrium_andersonii.AAC.1
MRGLQILKQSSLALAHQEGSRDPARRPGRKRKAAPLAPSPAQAQARPAGGWGLCPPWGHSGRRH